MRITGTKLSASSPAACRSDLRLILSDLTPVASCRAAHFCLIMPFLLHTQDDPALAGEAAANDYLKWLEDDDPAAQEEKQELQVLQNAVSACADHERRFEPFG